MIHTITPMLFQRKNLTGFFLDAGSMRLAFFQSWEPMITKIKSSTRTPIIPASVGKGNLILSKYNKNPNTSKQIATSQQIIAPHLKPPALPTGLASLMVLPSSVFLPSLSTLTILRSFFSSAMVTLPV